MSLNKAKIFTITSVKGGVGKTVNTLNLAGIFCNMGKKVLIIDLDLYCGDVACNLNLNYENDIYNLYEDLNNNKFDSLDNYICKYNNFIDVLASPKDPRFARKINSKVLDFIIYKSSLKYDIILIDTNHIITDINLFALDYSDQILYIINNDSVNLKNMKSMVSILSDMGKNNYKILLNESICKQAKYYNKYDIKNIINKNIDYIIKESFHIKNIDKYILDGEILTLSKKIYKQHKSMINIYNLLAVDLLKGEK